MSDFKPQNPQKTVGDALHQTEEVTSVIGTIDSGAVVRVDLTSGFVGTKVIEMEDVDRLFFIVDYVKNVGDDLRVRFMHGNDDDEAKLDVQEPREDNTVANEVSQEAIEHVFTATGRFIIDVPRLMSFMKVQVKSGGTPDTVDEVAVGFIGQSRGGA